MIIDRYESLAAFAKRAASANPGAMSVAYGESLPSWFGGVNYRRAVELAIGGDDSLVPQATAIFDQIDSAVDTPTQTWQPSPYGAYPIVPEYLAGDPCSMRLLSPAMFSSAPIGLYVGTDPSAGVTTENIIARGVAILALVMKLQAIRPITLTLLSENVAFGGADYTLAVDLNCQPLDLATACYALTSAGFVRHLLFGMVQTHGHIVAWPSRHRGGGAEWAAVIREGFGLGSQDLYIRAPYLDDVEQFENPIAWVNGHIARLSDSTYQESVNV